MADLSRCIETPPSITKTLNRLFLIRILESQRFRERTKYFLWSNRAFVVRDGFLVYGIFQQARNLSERIRTFLRSCRTCSIHCQALYRSEDNRLCAKLQWQKVFGSQLRWRLIECGYWCYCVLSRTSVLDQALHRSSWALRIDYRPYMKRPRVILNFLCCFLEVFRRSWSLSQTLFIGFQGYISSVWLTDGKRGKNLLR
jgi:hypothetical protein